MRHGDKINNLGRTAAHRHALLANLGCELIMHKRIVTTLAKARALRQYIEPLITKAKDNTTHQRRVVFSYLQQKEAVAELFGPVAEKVAGRPGGYTRIIKLGIRHGDNAEKALIELVDFNEVYGKGAPEAKEAGKKTRRGRSRKSGAAKAAAAGQAAAPEAAAKPETAADATSAAAEAPAAEAPEAGSADQKEKQAE